jgi:transcriptional regulator with GAF, ATPase, and Fis domain
MPPARPPLETARREQRLLAMLDTISRALAGRVTLPEAFAEITSAARDLLDFERIAVLRIERPGVLRVHAAAHGVSWTEGREIRREECSARLWIEPLDAPRIRDTHAELDPAFSMDREVIDRGTRSILRVPLAGRGGPIGALAFSSPSADAFDEGDVRTASAIAGLVALALEHERLLDNEVRRRSRVAALDAILPQLDELHDLDRIASTLSRLTRGLLPHDAISVGILHEGGAHIHSITGEGQRVVIDAPKAFADAQIRSLGDAGYALVRDIVVLDPATRRVRFQFARGDEEFDLDIVVDESAWAAISQVGIRSQVRVGIRRGDDLVGVVLFNARVPGAFTEEDAVIARRLAERVSLTLAHERLTQESRRASEASARAQALEARIDQLQRELEAQRGPHAVVGVSKTWREVLAQATRVAGTDTTVLLTGESGTGKEVVARFLHHASPRAAGPFVAINCAALPEQLLEAELFGHEKGAFTGAVAARIGRVEQAAGGVLFLDEVGEMSPAVQAKFLRVLQEREFQRLGSARVLKTDVRVIAATNRDLRGAIASGDFREDLYYRLHVFAIHLAPLRERTDDVLALAEHFLQELSATLGRGAAGMTSDARDALQRYAWPGNARELRNVLERAVILCDGGLIQPDHLGFAAAPARRDAQPAAAPLAEGPLPAEGVDLEAIERSLVQRALEQSAGNKSKAARLLGLTRAQLYTRVDKYRL